MFSKSIDSLLTKLNKTSEPFSALNMYNGNDWKKLVSFYPISLWKNDHMELILRNWNVNEEKSYFNNFSTVHTKILDGNFKSTTFLGPPNDLMIVKKLYSKQENFTFHPFSRVSLISLNKSITLQLYYYHHYY
jgi:hypothetical protein